MAPTSPWGRGQQVWPPEDTEEKPEVRNKGLSRAEAFALNKSEQVDLLQDLGVSDAEIKTLNNEEKRINKIMDSKQVVSSIY